VQISIANEHDAIFLTLSRMHSKMILRRYYNNRIINWDALRGCTMLVISKLNFSPRPPIRFNYWRQSYGLYRFAQKLYLPCMHAKLVSCARSHSEIPDSRHGHLYNFVSCKWNHAIITVIVTKSRGCSIRPELPRENRSRGRRLAHKFEGS